MRHFNYKTLDDLVRKAEDLGATHLRFETDPARLQEAFRRPVPLGRFQIGNSLCIHPMEGCDGDLDGTPGELTRRRYERFGRGGAKLVWFEATAVVPGGRANTRQLWINERNVGEYAALLDTMRRAHREEWGTDSDLLEPLQLAQSGRYSLPQSKTIAFHNPLIDEKTGTPADFPVITDDELDRLQDGYVGAAKLGAKAGFRAFDVKATHGYLLSELMGAKTRAGKYGGSIENRCRFVCDVLRRLRDELGPDIVLTVRLGCFDAVPYVRDPKTGLGVPLPFPVPYPWGFGVNPLNPLEPDLTEVKQAIALFRGAGMQLLNVSAGSPYYNPHIGRPFETPDEGNYEQPEHPLIGVDRHFQIAGELQRAFPDVPMVGTGYSWLQVYAPNAGAANILDGNITMMGMGRNALAYPDFARALLEHGALDERRVCKTLTYCTYLMRRKDHPLGQFPTGCPPFDKEVYGPIMKEARAVERAKKSRPVKCIFCEIVHGRMAGNVVYQDERAMAFLDARPLFPGHTLLVPREHVETLGDLPVAAIGPLFETAQRLSLAVESAMGAEGTFVAINNRVSQSVPHLHIHIVPRRQGDGLRGFFWPRSKYESPEEAARTADSIRKALA